MHMDSDIFLADAAGAFVQLAPEDDHTAQAIARLLGFDLPRVSATGTFSTRLGPVVPQCEARRVTPDRTDSEMGDVLPTYMPLPGDAPSHITISQATSPQSRSAAWLNTPPLDPFLPEEARQGAALGEPLFRRQWTRS